MSLDYPDYESIRGKSRSLAVLWQVGDTMYYVGLLGALFWLPLVNVLYTLSGTFRDRHLAIPVGLLGFGTFVAVFVLGGWLKGCARKKAG